MDFDLLTLRIVRRRHHNTRRAARTRRRASVSCTAALSPLSLSRAGGGGCRGARRGACSTGGRAGGGASCAWGCALIAAGNGGPERRVRAGEACAIPEGRAVRARPFAARHFGEVACERTVT